MNEALTALHAAISGQASAQMSQLFGQRTPNVKIKDAVLAVEPKAAVKRDKYGTYEPLIDGQPLPSKIKNSFGGESTPSDAWLQIALYVRDREAVPA